MFWLEYAYLCVFICNDSVQMACAACVHRHTLLIIFTVKPRITYFTSDQRRSYGSSIDCMPNITNFTSNKTVNFDDPFTFNCIATGAERIQLFLLYCDELNNCYNKFSKHSTLCPNDKQNCIDDQCVLTYNIPKTTNEYNGCYVCKASRSEDKSDSKCMYLTVAGK